MEPLALVFAALGGWTFDDFCGTPPRRPWPGPGPGPWWIRKVLALVGGAGLYMVVQDQVTDVLTTIVVGGVGGVVLASIVGAVMGGANVRAGE